MATQLKAKAADLEQHLLSHAAPSFRPENEQQGPSRTVSGRVTQQVCEVL
jgi:hypothetical protein